MYIKPSFCFHPSPSAFHPVIFLINKRHFLDESSGDWKREDCLNVSNDCLSCFVGVKECPSNYFPMKIGEMKLCS